ncbi:uncharacterized protein LOC133039726 [Cannabis sativa]|uniref:uncharacterized protein LOC133039726 n=1 Tax=Cannabis sativa TaxID=3483 RepID=UPI0029CA24EB|nr:uncharacterized protein LOC133039726 [Cannabis sativa]
MGRNKNAILGFLKDKMQKRIQSWEGRLLSKAGKEVLIKTVAQSFPTYAMSVFLLPVETCNKLEDLIKEGAHRVVGPGTNISVQFDLWLADDSQPWVTSSANGMETWTINDLMVVGERAWDLEVVLDIFNDRDKEIIIRTNIDQETLIDTWYWHKDLHGFYTMREAYRLLHHSEITNTSEFEIKIWKIAWRLHVPPKVHQLMWRALSGCLATKPHSATTLIHGPRRAAHGSLGDSRNAQQRRMGSLLVPTGSRMDLEHWVKPVMGKIKVNVDGAIFASDGRFGAAGVARDYQGRFIEGFTVLRVGRVDSAMAELVGVKEALNWIKRKQWGPVEVETASLVVIQAVQSTVDIPSPFGLQVAACHSLMADLPLVTINFVKRSVNKAVHCLAHSSCLYPDRIFSEDNVPADFLSLVMVESSY